MRAPSRNKAVSHAIPSWHAGFLTLRPAIEEQARFAFRQLPAEAREEAVAEVLAYACVAYARLAELGKEEVAYATPLARYGIARLRVGRHVGSSRNGNEVTSGYAQRRKGFRVNSIHGRDEDWRELAVEDKRATPAEVAVLRLDFTSWLSTLSGRDRRLADLLATGESTGRAARRFRLTAGRVSQIRRQLHRAWCRFQGETRERKAAAAATA